MTVRPERETLETLWAHIKPEPKMGGSYVVTRNRIPAELVGEVLAALAAAPDAWVAVTCPNCINGEDGTACAAWCPNAAPDARPPAFSPVTPHRYSPDWEAMGDCATCGNVEDAACHKAAVPDARLAEALAEILRPWDGWFFPDDSPVGRARAALAAAREGTRSGGDTG